jgi:RimJ/RimL family protein N-acetyltransferase
MRHQVSASGLGVRLRPVTLEDAAFIVWLRGLEHVRGKIGDSATTIAAQESWLQKYFERQGDYYFVIETERGYQVGAYGIYNVEGKSAESGRWIIRTDVPAAIPCAIVAFDLAFGELEMTELRVKTVATNQRVLSLNRKFGFRQTRVEPAAQIIGGQPVDLVNFLLEGRDWPRVRPTLLPLAKVAESQVREWESMQTAPFNATPVLS